MKIIKYILFSLVGLLASASFSACESADKEFEHNDNLIAWMQLCLRPGAQGLPGVIEEYDAQGNLVPADQVTVESVAGGYGVISFILDLDYKGEYNPEHCYLNTSLSFDEVIKPGLAGIKDMPKALRRASRVPFTQASALPANTPSSVISKANIRLLRRHQKINS